MKKSNGGWGKKKGGRLLRDRKGEAEKREGEEGGGEGDEEGMKKKKFICDLRSQWSSPLSDNYFIINQTP